MTVTNSSFLSFLPTRCKLNNRCNQIRCYNIDLVLNISPPTTTTTPRSVKSLIRLHVCSGQKRTDRFPSNAYCALFTHLPVVVFREEKKKKKKRIQSGHVGWWILFKRDRERSEQTLDTLECTSVLMPLHEVVKNARFISYFAAVWHNGRLWHARMQTGRPFMLLRIATATLHSRPCLSARTHTYCTYCLHLVNLYA